MHILIAAIGHLKKGTPEEMLIQDYLKKTRWDVEIKTFDVKKNLPNDSLKAAESALLLGAVPPAAKVVALDEAGELLSSRQFAQKIRTWRDMGTRDIAFLIGGANGHANSVRERADLTLSFGRMTLPHMLARVVLSEQIYRAYTLLNGHPYHRD